MFVTFFFPHGAVSLLLHISEVRAVRLDNQVLVSLFCFVILLTHFLAFVTVLFHQQYGDCPANLTNEFLRVFVLL